MKLLGLHLSLNLYINGGCEKFQIYGELQFLKDVLASQNIDSRYLYLYATTAPPLLSLLTIDPEITTLLQVLLSPLRRP